VPSALWLYKLLFGLCYLCLKLMQLSAVNVANGVMLSLSLNLIRLFVARIVIKKRRVTDFNKILKY